MSKKEYLEVINEEGNVISQETRENIHKHGLLHKEINLWFYTPRGEVIFQHRAKDKDTFPDLLDATVGGHVEIGDSFEETALKEGLEETGIVIHPEELHFIKFWRKTAHDEVTKTTNNVLRGIFAYKYLGDLQGLKLESGKSLGFELWPIEKLLSMNSEDKKRFIPGLRSENYSEIYHEIENLLNNRSDENLSKTY